MKNSLFVEQTQSTNTLLWEMLRKERLAEGFVVYTDFQTAGKGQIGNSWESEAGENLLFSIVLYPQRIPMDQLFLISQLVSLGIKKALDKYVDGITVKWPNDIYWNDKKMVGILIENSLRANNVRTVVGIGLNVNQKEFVSNAPNPVSLRQIVGKSINRRLLLKDICQNILELYNELNVESIRSEYAKMLYRKDGFYSYKAGNEIFQAKIISVQHDGRLELETTTGEQKGFYFKEVQFQ
jgi:BirA family transcriptional regulator, biotin operon repressor / biotin---[acetyl-CoA-carboxylase] ligase